MRHRARLSMAAVAALSGQRHDAAAAETLTTIEQDFADIDGEGDLDIVAVHTDVGERHRMLSNQGGGRFVDETSRYFPSSLRGDGIEVEIADFNSDGRLDLYFATYTVATSFSFNGSSQLLSQRSITHSLSA